MKNRYLYIDILKVIALVLMVCIHTYNAIFYFDVGGLELDLDRLSIEMGIIYLIVPGIFMFCMGCGISVSRHSNEIDMRRRGFKLLLIGLILNMVRASFCFIFAINDSSYFMEYIYWLLGSDILYFAGLYFILFSLFKRYKFNDREIFVCSFIMSLIGGIIPSININNDIISLVLGNFIYIDFDSCFPLIMWSIYPTMGYMFMNRYNKSKDRDRLFIYILLISIIVLLSIVDILFISNSFKSRYFLWGEEGFYMDIISTLISLSIMGIYIVIIYYLSRFIKNKKCISLISNISINVNKIYFIHWVIVVYFALILLFFNYKIKECYLVYVIGVCIFIISCVIAKYIRIRKKN